MMRSAVVIDMEIDMDDVEHITETAVTIRGTRRRVTVPKAIVDKLAIKDKDKLRWILFKDGNILVVVHKGGRYDD